MSKHPAPTKTAHQRFCLTEGWEETTGSRGRRGDHWRYVFTLPDGRVLHTRISHPISKRDTYGASLWARILRVDLHVTEDEFWDCVQNKVLPDRGAGCPTSRSTLPMSLYRLLLDEVGLTPAEIAVLDTEQASARLAEHYTHRH